MRSFLLVHRRLAAAIVALALFLKVLVPAGYMLANDHGPVTIAICTGYGPMKMAMAMPGMEHRRDTSGHQGKEMPCSFSALTAPSLAAADPVLLAIAIAFIIAAIFRMAIPGVSRTPAFLRPPLRGPPSHA